MIRTIIGAFSPLLAIGALVAALVLPGNSSQAQSRINGNQLVFVIGSGSSESFFQIEDKSRGATQYWVCGFIHDFRPNGFGGFTPSIQCNRGR